MAAAAKAAEGAAKAATAAAAAAAERVIALEKRLADASAATGGSEAQLVEAQRQLKGLQAQLEVRLHRRSYLC